MEREPTPLPTPDQVSSSDDDRREFLKRCGKFAATVPPAVTMLLSTSLTSEAIAASGSKPGNGYGDKNHIHTGPRGRH
nr:hypothetical protein [Microvirga massiliensis]